MLIRYFKYLYDYFNFKRYAPQPSGFSMGTKGISKLIPTQKLMTPLRFYKEEKLRLSFVEAARKKRASRC